MGLSVLSSYSTVCFLVQKKRIKKDIILVKKVQEVYTQRYIFVRIKNFFFVL